MNKCIKCQDLTFNPKYCSRSCSVSRNNKLSPKRVQKAPRNCRYCNKPIASPKVYCNLSCQKEFEYETRLNAWLKGEATGLSTIGTVRGFVKRWLRETRGNRCELCSWNQVNVYTNKIPLVADHIDGIWQNNRPENLQLICPNCDSLQPTYKAANKGKGRTWRRQS